MKSWLLTFFGLAIFWLLTDMQSGSAFRNLFSPLMFTIFTLLALGKVVVFFGATSGNGGFGSGDGGGFGGGGDCGGGDGGC